jgi:ubiquinone/menaquinone biosynthesis C-methylase UbiE
MANPRAEAFDEWARRGAGARMEEAHGFAGKKVLDRIPIGYDESFIDLGCGSGWATRYVAEKVPTIGLCVGVDISPELIKEARQLSAGKFPVKFLVAPMENVPFGEGSFKHAFSMEAIYYTEDPLEAARAIWRILKPQGTFHLIIDFYAENPMSKDWQSDFSTKMHFLGQDEWVSLLGQAGFDDVRAERVLDDRPVEADLRFPWGGFATREDLARFRTSVGSLYIVGRKVELSRALDPYLDRARQGLAGDDAKAKGPRGEPPAEAKKKKRRGLF